MTNPTEACKQRGLETQLQGQAWGLRAEQRKLTTNRRQHSGKPGAGILLCDLWSLTDVKKAANFGHPELS